MSHCWYIQSSKSVCEGGKITHATKHKRMRRWHIISLLCLCRMKSFKSQIAHSGKWQNITPTVQVRKGKRMIGSCQCMLLEIFWSAFILKTGNKLQTAHFVTSKPDWIGYQFSADQYPISKSWNAYKKVNHK